MTTAPQSSRRGRPRDPERMRRVLEAAARQFLENGFARASMEAVARASGVSKMTIYSYFPTKEALFETVVSGYTEAVFGELPPEALDPLQPRTALTRIGAGFLRLKRCDDVVKAFRLMYAAAGEQPAACEAFYRQGPEKLARQAAEYLRAAAEAGSLALPSPELAAGQFLALFMGGPHIRVMLGLGKPTEEEDQGLVRANVEMFLRAYGV